jgi:hypothetical protein
MKSHWRKLDHIAFLLMLPLILFMTLYSALLFSMGDGNYAFIIISVSGLICFFLWTIALAYDLMEEKEAKPT